MKSPITTHVLDTAQGRPAAGIMVRLEKRSQDQWVELAKSVTNENGRIDDFEIEPGDISREHYRLSFYTKDYFDKHRLDRFFPEVQIQFEVGNPDEHYHIPLLLSPFGYSTYRGS